ncbi:MAG: hypothetical protein EOM20_05085 [Spartobacteria bacterium]|nr:hypothetical protein [Spartobacteria bacterium]
MSLIQEALRRQDNNGPPRLQGDGMSVGPPPVPPMRPPREEKGARAWVGIVVVAVVMLGLLGGSIALLSFVVKSTSKEEPKAPVQEAAPTSTPEKAVKAPPPTVAPTPAVAPPKEQKTEAPRTPPAVAEKPVEKEEAREVPIATPNIKRRAEKPKAEAADEPSGWPVIQLTGVLTKARQEDSAAMINGEIIFVGDRYEGITVLEVNSTGVLLEYNGSKRFLRVGRTMR